MKPEFANLSADFWLHDGRLGRSRQALCLYHHDLSVGSPILAALHELTDEAQPAQRKLTFAPCDRERPFTELRIRHVDPTADLRVVSIRYAAGRAVIEATPLGLPLVVDGVQRWLDGAEDFGISSDQAGLKAKELGRLDRDSLERWFWGPRCYAP